MSEPKPPVVISRRVLHSIVVLTVLALAVATTSILFTVAYVAWTNSHQQAAQAKAAIPLCGALHNLALIKGTHGDSGATYGANLEKAFEHLYAATNCSQIMKGKS